MPIGLLLLFVLTVVGWKALRRHRRRRRPTPTARNRRGVGRGDRPLTEAGAPPLTAVTPHERVQAYVREQHLDDVEPDLRVLAGHVDRATYAASAPDDGHAADAWRASDEVSAELRRTRTTTQRLRMHLDPRPLRRDHPTTGHGRPSGERP